MNEEDKALHLEIPLLGGDFATIEHCRVDHHTHKILGTMTCPSGKNEAALTCMKKWAQAWIDQATSEKLARQTVWMLAEKQLWPKVGFGIGVCSASYMELAECLMKQYYNLVPLGEIRCSTNWMVCQLDCGFYGVTCPHPAVECLLAQLNHLLCRFGCNTAVSRLQQVSWEYLVVELGMGPQPFQLDFEWHGNLVTHSWLKSVWEKDILWCQNQIYSQLMPLFVCLGFDTKDLLPLNWVQLHQQVFFVSDVMDTRGLTLDHKYWKRRR